MIWFVGLKRSLLYCYNETMIPIASLIFDLDGTLVDSSRDIASSVNHTLQKIGLSAVSEEKVKESIGDGMKKLLVRLTGTDEEQSVKAAIDIFRPHYFEHCTDSTTLYPGVQEVLNFFKSKKMALVTNKPLEMTLKILKRFGIEKYFSVISGGESTKEKKPHPEPLLEAMKRMKASKEPALMIGDGITDIQAGKSAAVLTCAVTYGYRSRNELESCDPDIIIDRLETLKTLLY